MLPTVSQWIGDDKPGVQNPPQLYGFTLLILLSQVYFLPIIFALKIKRSWSMFPYPETCCCKEENCSLGTLLQKVWRTYTITPAKAGIP